MSSVGHFAQGGWRDWINGRPPADQLITFRIQQPLLDRVSAIAEKREMTMSNVLSTLVENAVVEVEAAESSDENAEWPKGWIVTRRKTGPKGPFGPRKPKKEEED